MNNKEAIEFGKSQLEIFSADSKMSEFIRLAIKALEHEIMHEIMFDVFKSRK